MQEDIDQKARDSARQTIAPIRSALYDFDAKALSAAIRAAFAPAPIIQLAYPFERLSGADDFFESALSPLAHAFASFERRDAIVMAGAPGDAVVDGSAARGPEGRRCAACDREVWLAADRRNHGAMTLQSAACETSHGRTTTADSAFFGLPSISLSE